MKIGELSRATKASTRSLRYYEELGLIRSERRANGYRDYDQATVATVTTIKSLIGLGFPTAAIAEVLACETGGLPDDCAAVRSRVAFHNDRLDQGQVTGLDVAEPVYYSRMGRSQALALGWDLQVREPVPPGRVFGQVRVGAAP